MRGIATASMLFISAFGATTGVAHAQPGPAAEAVSYTAHNADQATVITTDGGSMVVQDNLFKIKAANGATLAATELSFRVDDFVFPIAARITDHAAVLTPQLDLAHASYQPVALPFEDQAPWKSQYDREQAAWNRLSTTVLMGATLGTVVGSVGGAAVGCVLGGIAGATVAAATIVGLFGPFLPAAAIGCIGGVMALGALGTVAGQLLVTAPVAVMAAIQYFTTINAPLPGGK